LSIKLSTFHLTMYSVLGVGTDYLSKAPSKHLVINLSKLQLQLYIT
jgi:hypothetical protein